MYSKHSRTTQRYNTMSTFVSAHDVKECPICYEEIGNKNTCTTECGHTFCFKCMAASIQRNVNCPCCRFELIERASDEDEDMDEISDEEDDDAEDRDDDDEEEEEEIEATVEHLAAVFEKKGYTLHDALSLLCGRLSKQENKNTNEYYEKMSEDFDNMLIECDTDAIREYEERETMAEEDVRVVKLCA